MSALPVVATPGLLVLNQASIAKINYSLGEVLHTVEQAIKGLRQSGSLNPPKVVIEGLQKQSLAYSMAGREGASRTVGFKAVYEFDPDRSREAYQFYSFIFLCDDATGAPIALLDVVLLGPLRTSATSALLARCIAPHARTALVVGTGAQGRIAPAMLAAALPQLERLIVHGHHAEGLREVAATLARYHPGRKLELSTDLQQSAAAADIIIGVAGSGAREEVRRAWMKPGSVAILVGYGIHADVLQGADYVVATDAAQMRITSSDLADANGTVPEANAELPELLLGNSPPRRSDTDVVFAYNSGLVVTDIAVGRLLAQRARQQHLGFEVALW